MLYRLYLYCSSAATGSAPAIDIVNCAISTNSDNEWYNNLAADSMRPFNTDAVVSCIKKELTDSVTGVCKCHPTVKYPPMKYNQIGFIYVATSYAMAADVLPRLYTIATENNLVLYDAETGRSFYKDLVDKTYITMRNRQQMLNNAILNDMKPVWNIRRVEFLSEKTEKSCSYVVTIRKDSNTSFAERNVQFYECLKKNLHNKEKLFCKNKQYSIVGEWYTINYVLEGYKKHPDKIGYVENGVPCVSLLRRMSVVEACRWTKNCTDTEINDIQARMHFREMKDRYPNTAQRFVESVKITKLQRKQLFDIRYSNIGYYGSEILFHVVPDSYYENDDEISVLKIDESSASFILPFINDIYPYFYERYYLEKNHISEQMWKRIIDRLEEAKKMILYDTFSPDLKSYIEEFDLYVFDDYEKSKHNTETAKFVFEHRYEIASFYDIFVEWSNAQFRTHSYCSGLMFNIQGP